MPICRKLATNDRLGHDSSRMMTRRNELTGSSLILFWQVSSLSLLLPLLTNAICLAVFYRVTMANVRETSRSPRSTNKKGERRRWSSGKSLPSLPFCEIEGCFYLGWSYSLAKLCTCCWTAAAFIPPVCTSIRSCERGKKNRGSWVAATQGGSSLPLQGETRARFVRVAGDRNTRA